MTDDGADDSDRELDDELLRAFGDELVRFNRRHIIAPPGSMLGLSAFRILWRLVEAGPRTVGELSDDLQLEQSTMSRQVSAAVDHGLVERATDTHGHHVLQPTPEGERGYRHDSNLRAIAYRAVLKDLGTERVRLLVESMRAFSEALDHARS